MIWGFFQTNPRISLKNAVVVLGALWTSAIQWHNTIALFLTLISLFFQRSALTLLLWTLAKHSSVRVMWEIVPICHWSRSNQWRKLLDFPRFSRRCLQSIMITMSMKTCRANNQIKKKCWFTVDKMYELHELLTCFRFPFVNFWRIGSPNAFSTEERNGWID